MPMGGAVRGGRRVKCSMQSFGFSRPEPAGRICPIATLPTKPAIDVSSSGCATDRSSASCRSWPPTCATEGGWTLRKATSTERSFRQKRGPLRGEN